MLQDATPIEKAVLITGCSSGFGLDIAATLAKAGYRVYATMRNLNRSAGLREAVRNTNTEILRLDVCDPQSIDEVMEHIGSTTAALDAVVNNAGYGVAGMFADLTEAEIRDQFETNFFGPLAVLRAALPLLRRSDSATIVNVSSISGRAALPGVGAYASSKWALEGLTESLRLELGRENIRVYLVEPGVFRTPGVDKNIHVAERVRRGESVDQRIADRMLSIARNHAHRVRPGTAPVSRLVRRLIRRRPRRFRWLVGRFRSPHYWTRRLLPFVLHEWLVKKIVFRGGSK